MDKIWEYMRTSGAYERHHIIAIVRTMAKGYVHVDITMSEEIVVKLQALGLTVVQIQGALHRVAWGDIGFENDDAGHTPSENEKNQKPKRKKTKIVKVYEEKSEVAAWQQYIKSMGVNSENKHGIGRVE